MKNQASSFNFSIEKKTGCCDVDGVKIVKSVWYGIYHLYVRNITTLRSL